MKKTFWILLLCCTPLYAASYVMPTSGGTPNDGTVTTAKLAAGAVTADKVDATTVPTLGATSNTFTGTVIANDGVSTTQLKGSSGLVMPGASSGSNFSIVPHPSTAAYTFTAPPTGGTSGYLLRTDGTGVTTWVAPASAGNLTGPITSTGLATSIASQTGTGSTFVMSAAPTITGHMTVEGVTPTGATGTGNLVFSAAPTFTGTLTAATTATTDLTVTNTITGTAASANAIKSATTTVNTASATAPSSGQVLTATSSSAATWQTPLGGSTGSVYLPAATALKSLTNGAGSGCLGDVFVQAGGGGGSGSGGGAGGNLAVVNKTMTINYGYAIVVGTGGAVGAVQSSAGTNGTNSSFDGNAAVGGGGGEYIVQAIAPSGGCGGGQGPYGANSAPDGPGTSTQTSVGGFTGYGNAGGHRSIAGPLGSGGGGGIGAVGGDATSSIGGAGGAGLPYWDGTGAVVYYGGGGGGGAYFTAGNDGGAGGNGGGGTAGHTGVAATTPRANSGGGGGGADKFGTPSAGAAGIVGIRINRAYGAVATGGTHTSDANYDYWMFTSNGTFTITSVSNSTQFEMTTNKVNIGAISFVQAAQTYTEWEVPMPLDYNGGTVSAQFFWTANSTSTNAVVWSLEAGAFPNGTALDTAYGSAQTVTQSNTSTAYKLNQSSATSAITIAGSPAAGVFTQFRASRVGTNGSDLLGAPALLLGVKVTYTRQ